MEKIWLSSPHMGGNELKYIHQAFDQNWVAPLGPNVEEFEYRLESFIGQNKKVAALSSGTAALHLALIQCGVSAGDVVLCQSLTFAASANPIAYLGATPVFIDSERETWNLCPGALEEALAYYQKKGIQPKAIIAVHLYGMPYQVDKIHALSNKYNVPIIEDAAEALGSFYRGQSCGTFGVFGVLSFNGNKIITTSGGGALVVNGVEVKQHTVFLATQARDQAPHYQHSQIGYNYRMSNISAGIGCGQMEVLQAHVELRRKMNVFYHELFRDSHIHVHTECNDQYHSNHWLSCILTNGYEQRETIRLALEKENIESRPLWKPMHLQPVFANAKYFGENVAEELFEKGLCLPSGSNLSEQQKARIQNAFQNLKVSNSISINI